MAVGSVWHRPGRKPGLRSKPKFWRELQAQGRCMLCWKPRQRAGATCDRCRERQKLAMRRSRGWDGISEWKPKRTGAGRALRHHVGCTVLHEDYVRLKQIMDDEGKRAGTVLREALQSYLGDIFDEPSHEV